MATKKKKTAAKQTRRAMPAGSSKTYRPDNKNKSVPAAATTVKGVNRMSDRIVELEKQVSELDDQVTDLRGRNGELLTLNATLETRNAELGAKVDELEAKAAEELEELAAVTQMSGRVLNMQARADWKQGKLPGDKLIKIHRMTGAFEPVEREEWDSLA
jgi:regulator of replication initiation timing